jgi:hypothetical protein
MQSFKESCLRPMSLVVSMRIAVISTYNNEIHGYLKERISSSESFFRRPLRESFCLKGISPMFCVPQLVTRVLVREKNDVMPGPKQERETVQNAGEPSAPNLYTFCDL